MSELAPIEVEVRGLYCSPGQSGQAVALLGRRGGRAGGSAPALHEPVLSLQLPATAIAELEQALGRGQSLVAEAVQTIKRLASALRGQLVAVHLTAYGPDIVQTSIDLQTPNGPMNVPVEPAVAIAVAVKLQLPLLADRELLEPDAVAPIPFRGIRTTWLDLLGSWDR